jgi:polyphenol oxidase
MKTNLKKLTKDRRFAKFDDLVIGFSDKSNGQMKFSPGNREEVLANREKFLTSLGIAGKGILVRANQVHSNRNLIIDNQDIASGPNRFSREIEAKNTDGLITSLNQVWLAVTVADCVPLLIWSKDLNVVAAVHAGWQGTLAKITAKAIGKIKKVYQTDPEKLFAWVGPSIGPKDFEVKDDVWQPFKKKFDNNKAFSKIKGKKYIDLWQINKDQLLSEGLINENIVVQGESTYSVNNYYSYRQGEDGRMMALIGINR